MNRVEAINYLIDKYDKKSYLELGTRNAVTYRAVKASRKVGVDPNSKVFDRSIYTKTSDAFFKINKTKFDVVFIDGLHEAEQVKRDIKNAEAILNKGGFIILHDASPLTEKAQRYPQPKEKGTWNGTVWEAIVDYRKNGTKGLVTINTDHGLAVISEHIKTPKLKSRAKVSFANLEKNRVKWLNLVTPEEFKEVI